MSKNISSGSRWQLPLVCVTAMLISLLTLAPAHAAPAGPTGLSPNGATVSANPVLQWSRVSAASEYDVEVSATSDFGTLLYDMTTTNRRVTPTAQLPASKIWWRVRAKSSTGTSRWTTATFTRGKLPGPELKEPADGALLEQPAQPPLLSWDAISGASGYTVEVDRGATADWVDVQSSTTQTTSLVVPDPQENGQYWWRVRAELGTGQSTYPSAARSFFVGPLPVVGGVTPADSAPVEEVVLEWDRVPGAVSYDIRVSTDDSFNEIIDAKVVKGTRYSPPKTYNVDDYWWQVRARNIFGKAKEWADVPEEHQFRRTWQGDGAQPVLLHPANVVSPPAGDDFYFQWSPSRLATRYRLDLGTDPNFSPDSFESCFTTQTTYTPGYYQYGKPADKCRPGIGVTHYWRVKALDALKTETSTEIQGVYSAIHRFVYAPGQLTQVAPLTGSTVDIPTLRWEPALDADRYYVVVKWQDGSQTRSVSETTYSTSWTPTGSSKLDPAKGPFTWTVQAVDHHGVKTPLPVFNAGEQFDISGALPSSASPPLTPLTPTPGAAATPRFPELTWEPVANAAYYRVWIGTAGSGFIEPLADKFPYPAATDNADGFLSAGSYDWYVAAYDSTNVQIGTQSNAGTFTVENLPEVNGNRVALNGSGFDPGATTCEKSLLTDPPNVCSGMKATPVLDWEPVEGAGYYMVYLSRDRNFQNMVYGSYSDSTKIPTTTNTMWTPIEALDDSQAGVAYYWYIRPCKAPGNCSPDPLLANHAFDKRSNQVETVAPVVTNAVVPEVDNAVTFDWVDYLETNQKTAFNNPFTGEQSGQAARSYHLQVSTSPAFTTLLDDQTVDQTTFTAYTEMYPEGQLYWRVQAIDGSGNGLAWSEPIEFSKQSPKPTPMSPNGPTTATQPFRWSAAPYAASYDLEVYKNADTAASRANLVLDVNSKQVAYTPAKPLPAGTTYVWRVRRVDDSRNDGQWSGWTSFQMNGIAPTSSSPAHRAKVAATDALFDWQPPALSTGASAGATSYQFERREAGSTRIYESVKTASTAWAPYRTITAGTWQWRVSSLDAAGKTMGSSAWRTFYVKAPPPVDTTAPRIVRYSPSTTAKRRANFAATFSERVYNVNRRTMKLYVRGRARAVPARVTLSANHRTAKLNPSRKLKPGKYYTLKVSSRIKDRRGNALRSTYWRVRAK